MSSLRPFVVQRLTTASSTLHLRVRPRTIPKTHLSRRARAFTTIPGIPTPEEDDDSAKGKRPGDDESRWNPIFWKSLESTFTTLASVTVLGYAYFMRVW
jgi:hypothetical protein